MGAGETNIIFLFFAIRIKYLQEVTIFQYNTSKMNG
jgi:hypothetical protein